MSDRSFIESWSLDVDDIAFVEGFNLVSRVWVALQLRFFRTQGRFPSRPGVGVSPRPDRSTRNTCGILHHTA